MDILLDTDVFSCLLRQRPEGADILADRYRPYIEDRIVAISFVTVGELYYGAARRKWSPNRTEALEAKLASVVIVPYDVQICKTYTRLKSGLRTFTGSHRVVGDNDLWIAASAVSHSIPLITHNRRHFEGIPDLEIFTEAPSA
jgi:tRNA(fMet)-specific endonuclease VapC